MKKPAMLGTASGCLIWLITFAVLGSCLIPVGVFAGVISSTFGADYVARILEPYLCPEGSQAQVHTYATTQIDENGFEKPSTGYEVRCVDASGSIVKDLGASYAFIWIGVIAAVILVLTALLALLLAAPAGALIARWRSRSTRNQRAA